MALAEQKCEPYRAGTMPLPQDRAEELLEEIPLWTLEDKMVQREFRFNDFRESIAFVNKVAEVAEEQDHHPDIHISYNRVLLELSTHKIGGLTDNDFILAARVDRIVG
jgi:4a-hydroxytetrahydrobiopterin dehydratase